MNSEQLKKINELAKPIKEIEYIIRNDFSIFTLRKKINYFLMPFCHSREIILKKELIEPILISYCDKLKQELKELGYEE
jgi:hypothetical protein